MNETPVTEQPAPAGAPASVVRAWRSPKAWAVFVCVLLAGLVTDLWTKDWAFRTVAGMVVVLDRHTILEVSKAEGPARIGLVLPPHQPQVVIPNLLEFTLVLNPGAVFGIGPGQRWFFLTFTPFAMAAGLALFAFGTKSRDTVTHIALGLLISGGLGNFYDRLAFGCVRDFFHPLPGVKFPFGWKLWTKNGEIWPYVNNIADVWLIVGILTLIIILWRHDSARKVHAA